jgi:hypothetical protein
VAAALGASGMTRFVSDHSSKRMALQSQLGALDDYRLCGMSACA